MNEKLKPLFLNLYAMVLADDKVDPQEIATLYEIGSRDYGLTPSDVNLYSFGEKVPYEPQSLVEKVRFLYNLGQIAWADGIIDEREKVLLKEYAAQFGFLDNNIEGIVEEILKATSPSSKKTFEQLMNEID